MNNKITILTYPSPRNNCNVGYIDEWQDLDDNMIHEIFFVIFSFFFFFFFFFLVFAVMIIFAVIIIIIIIIIIITDSEWQLLNIYTYDLMYVATQFMTLINENERIPQN